MPDFDSCTCGHRHGGEPCRYSGCGCGHPDNVSPEKVLRRMLWLRHGCPQRALYGDDGEMQCGTCLIDFRRASPHDIEKAMHEIAFDKLAPLDPLVLARSYAKLPEKTMSSHDDKDPPDIFSERSIELAHLRMSQAQPHYGEASKDVSSALCIIERFGMLKGEGRKQWIIDQMLRTLLGPDRYEDWVAQRNESPNYDTWDVGLAP